jgi:hypothetical protein
VRAQYREDELVPENAHLAGKAQTVLGPIEPEHLGIEPMHEHARRFGQFGRRLAEDGRAVGPTDQRGSAGSAVGGLIRRLLVGGVGDHVVTMPMATGLSAQHALVIVTAPAAMTKGDAVIDSLDPSPVAGLRSPTGPSEIPALPTPET